MSFAKTGRESSKNFKQIFNFYESVNRAAKLGT